MRGRRKKTEQKPRPAVNEWGHSTNAGGYAFTARATSVLDFLTSGRTIL